MINEKETRDKQCEQPMAEPVREPTVQEVLQQVIYQRKRELAELEMLARSLPLEMNHSAERALRPLIIKLLK